MTMLWASLASAGALISAGCLVILTTLSIRLQIERGTPLWALLVCMAFAGTTYGILGLLGTL